MDSRVRTRVGNWVVETSADVEWRGKEATVMERRRDGGDMEEVSRWLVGGLVVCGSWLVDQGDLLARRSAELVQAVAFEV